MTTDEHVPSDARMREQYIWAHAREAEGVAEQSYGIQVCSETWDAWLTAHDARVRRDAAREALDGLAAWMSDLHDKYPSHAWYVPLSLDNIARYTTGNYPEEAP